MDSVDSGNKPKFPRGRPKKQDAPTVDWETVDRALVFGEKFSDPKTGVEIVRYPTYKDIANRLGLSATRVWQYASKNQCMQRREEVRGRAREQYAQQVIESDSKTRTITNDDIIKLLDTYIIGFAKAMAENRVRCDSPADLERMVRLKEFLLGNAKAEGATSRTIMLDQIRQRHVRAVKMLDLIMKNPKLTGALN